MIIIGVPTTGAIPVKVVGCIENVLLNRKEVYPYYVEGSLVYDARCKIANYAIEKGADLLFLDSDICFPLEGFDRLAAHKDADIISGLYYDRQGTGQPIAYKTIRPKRIRPARIERIDKISDYMQVEGVGLGFCFIRNRVLTSLSHKINPFEPFGNLGEDFSFLYRCRQKGFKIMLDTTFELKHLGEFAFTFRESNLQSVNAPDSF